MFFQNGAEMIGVLLADVFDTKIIYDKVKTDWSPVMCP